MTHRHGCDSGAHENKLRSGARVLSLQECHEGLHAALHDCCHPLQRGATASRRKIAEKATHCWPPASTLAACPQAAPR